MSRTKTQEEEEKNSGNEGAGMKEPKPTIAKMQQRDSLPSQIFPAHVLTVSSPSQALHVACQVREAGSALSPVADVHRPDNSRLRQSLTEEAPAHSDRAPMVVLKPIFYGTPVRSQGKLRWPPDEAVAEDPRAHLPWTHGFHAFIRTLLPSSK